MHTEKFVIRGQWITLDRLLKASGVVPSGGAAHALVEGGEVTVDGKPESRKRARLHPGQEVYANGCRILLYAAAENEA